MTGYIVRLENGFDAENPADAVLQMAAWVTDHGYEAGYRVTHEVTGVSIFMDAEELNTGRCTCECGCNHKLDGYAPGVLVCGACEDNCPAPPTCDICGFREEDTEHWTWNGETGNHKECEAKAELVALTEQIMWGHS